MPIRSVACALVAVAASVPCLAGPLNPPGGPIAPTNKTLDEVEPRTPIGPATTPAGGGAVFEINTPGHYYLTGDVVVPALSSGIRVNADSTTVDLNGFRIVGQPNSANGIHIDARFATVRNGSIETMGEQGVLNENLQSRFYDLTVTECELIGLEAGAGSVVERCVVRGCGEAGAFTGAIQVGSSTIVADVYCSVSRSDGIVSGSFCIFERCRVTGSSGTGIDAGNSSVFIACETTNNLGSGADVGNESVVVACISRNNDSWGFVGSGSAFDVCRASINGLDGFQLNSRSTATGCSATSNTGAGFKADSYGAMTGCVAQGNSEQGFDVGRGCVLTECLAHDNTLEGILTISGGTNANVLIESCASTDNAGAGISAGNAAVVRNCSSTNNDGHGILVGGASQVVGCTARQSGLDGINAGGDSLVLNNLCDSNGSGAAIEVTSTDCRIEGNHVIDNMQGIVSAGGSLVIRNSASNNAGGNFSFQASDLVGPTVSGSGVIGSTNPWANFEY